MRPTPIGSTGLGYFSCQTILSARRVKIRWLLVILGVLIAPAGVRAQAPATSSAAATPASPDAIVPLGRFFPKDNLAFYFEFAGLNAHADSWKKTAACKMLMDTPLGGMLEEVASQLLDKGLSLAPDRKFTGAEIVTLVKHAAQSGFAMGLQVNPKETEPTDVLRITFVLRGGASKPVRPITSRVMGLMMGTQVKPKIEFREGRSLVFVPAISGAANRGWSWWAEKNDLVMSSSFPKGVEATLAVLDGKNSSAVEHPIVQELSKPDGTFQPVCKAFIDTVSCMGTPAKMSEFFQKLNEKGIHRLDVRWGFDDDALMTVARLKAPAPRQVPASIFDQPTFDTKSLIPLPEGVDSFLELSMNPATFLKAITELPSAEGLKTQFDELTEAVRSGQGRH